MPEIQGKNILEVWDYRLSEAVPQLNRSGATWVAEVWPKHAPDYDPERPETLAAPLETYDTKIPVVEGDAHDPAKIAECYAWLRSVRDKYSRPDIDARKTVVAKFRAHIDAAHTLNAQLHAEG